MDDTGRRRTFWLIVGNEDGHLGLFVMDRGEGRRTLPVFSYREEAEAFHRLENLGPGWRVRQSAAGEIISVLYSLAAGVGQVALDPLPEVCGEELVDLVSLDRERFARTLAGETRPLFSRSINGNGHPQKNGAGRRREPSEGGIALREPEAPADRGGSGDDSGSPEEAFPDYVMRDFGLPGEARNGSEVARRATEDRDAGEI